MLSINRRYYPINYWTALILLQLLACLAQAQQINSPIGDHLVGTVLGTPDTLADTDYRTDAEYPGLGEFIVAPTGQMYLTDRVQSKVFRIDNDGIVRTFAGDGHRANTGDGSSALTASVSTRDYIAADRVGNIYLAASKPAASQVGFIRKVGTDGTITTVAGNGTSGCPEDGANALTSPLGFIASMTVSAEGELYFATFLPCYKIFRLDSNGVIHHVAGQGGSYGASLYYSQTVPAVEMMVGTVIDMAFDLAGNLAAVFDNGACRTIGLITPTGFAKRLGGCWGSSTPEDPVRTQRVGPIAAVQFGVVVSLAVDEQGEIIIAQSGSQVGLTVRQELGRIDGDGNYHVIASEDGFGGSNLLQYDGKTIIPDKVRVGPTGDIYIKQKNTNIVFVLTESGEFVPYTTQPAATRTTPSTETTPKFHNQIYSGLASDSNGNLYLGTVTRLYKLTPNGSLLLLAGRDSGGTVENGSSGQNTYVLPAIDAPLYVDQTGALYWMETPGRIRRLTATDKVEGVFGSNYSATLLQAGKPATDIYQEIRSWGIAADGTAFILPSYRGSIGIPSFGPLWTTDTNGLAQKIREGVGQRLSLNDRNVYHFSVSPSGSIFVADTSDPLYRINTDGSVTQVTGKRPGTPTNGAPAIDGPSYIYRIGKAISDTGYAFFPVGEEYLTQVTVGGNLQHLRSSFEGKARRDGVYLKDDRLMPLKSVTRLPDGGFAWVESHRNGDVIRRSFPVPAGCTYSVTPSQIDLGNSSTTTSISINTGSNCPWTIGSPAKWAAIQGKRFGYGSAVVPLHIAANPGVTARTISLAVAGKEVQLRQNADTTSTLFSVSPTSAKVAATGGQVTISVTASQGVAWTAVLSDPNLKYSGRLSGVGNGQFTVILDELLGGIERRSYTITINGQVVTITQELPGTMVSCTIQASKPGIAANIDGANHMLPHTVQWRSGTTHWVEFPEYVTPQEGTLRQFQRFGPGLSGGGNNPRTAVFTVPATGCSIQAEYRTLHLVEATVSGNPANDIPNLLTEFYGAFVAERFNPIRTGGHVRHWMPEGSTFRLLAPNTNTLQFSRFAGLSDNATNPLHFVVDGPRSFQAVYENAPSPRSDRLSIGSSQIKWSVTANTQQTISQSRAVVAVGAATSAASSLFVSYPFEVGLTPWFTVTKDRDIGEFTLEASMDISAYRSNFENRSSYGTPSVWIHSTCCTTLSNELLVDRVEYSDTSNPVIDALTDAGAFRTNLGGVQPLHAAGMIVSLFGRNLASSTESAATVPLPTALASTRVEVRNPRNGVWEPSPLFYVSPGQINFQLLPDFDASSSTASNVRVVRHDVSISNEYRTSVNVRVPSFFSANSSGSGAPAGLFVRVLPNQEQQRGPLANCTTNGCVDTTLSFGPAGSELYLELYGTGLRNTRVPDQIRAFIGGKEAAVVYAGAHPDFVGLDQVNVRVPADVPRGVPVDIYVWVTLSDSGGWTSSNRLTLRFQ